MFGRGLEGVSRKREGVRKLGKIGNGIGMVILVTEEELVFKKGEDFVGEFINVEIKHGGCRN